MPLIEGPKSPKIFLVQLALIAACLGGFLGLTYDQLKVFSRGSKTVAVSFEESRLRSFPVFVFCDSRGFVQPTFPPPVTEEDYRAAATNVSGTVRLVGAGETDNRMRKVENATVKMIPTVYNGLCKVSGTHS